MRKLLLSVLVALATLPARAEVNSATISVTPTAQTYTFPAKTKFVLVISDGASTCYYRLFNDRDTVAAAVVGNLTIKTGESKTYDLLRQTTTQGADSQGSATYWKAISMVCGVGDLASFRIESF